MTALALAAVVLYSTLSFQRFARFQSAGYDLGIFDQMVRQYSHFAPPYSQIKGTGFNILGDHFHPIIAALAPLYWLWDGPRGLGIAMAVLLAASVFPVWERAFRRAAAEVLIRSLVARLSLQWTGWPFRHV